MTFTICIDYTISTGGVDVSSAPTVEGSMPETVEKNFQLKTTHSFSAQWGQYLNPSSTFFPQRGQRPFFTRLRVSLM